MPDLVPEPHALVQAARALRSVASMTERTLKLTEAEEGPEVAAAARHRAAQLSDVADWLDRQADRMTIP